jgi:esterase
LDTTFQPEDKWFIDGRMKFHYLDWGNQTAQPMVLVHAFTGTARYWDFFSRKMKDDFHVLAMDQRGHGDSSRADKYSPREYVADLTKFIDALDLKDIVLIGHSLGGINSIVYAAEHPDRVSCLVVVDIGPEISPEGIAEIQTIMANRPEFYSSKEEAFRKFRQERPRHSDEFIHHLIKYIFQTDASGRLYYKFDPALRLANMASSTWLWPFLKRIICPVLIVRGAESPMLHPDSIKKMIKALPQSTAVTVEKATHGVPGDNPQGLEKVVRHFLERYATR